jgi:hypothetical protein
MSSPKTAAAKTARRPKPVARTALKPVGKAANGANVSTEAARLAAEIERALAGGKPDVLTTAALQALMGAVCKTYAAQVEAGSDTLPLPMRGGATATDVMVTASGLLKAANLAVFELGMWQSWTGR